MNDRTDIPERRRRLLVDKPFQYALIRLLATMWLINMVVLGGLIYYLYVGPVFRVDHLAGQPNVETLNSSPPQFGVLLTLGAVAGLALVIVVGLHMSHQVAGPLAQMKTKLRDVARGDMCSEVRFREGDYLADLPDCFNDMMEALRERGRNEVATLRDIEVMLDAASPARERLFEFLREKEALLAGPKPTAAPESPETTKQSDPLPAR